MLGMLLGSLIMIGVSWPASGPPRARWTAGSAAAARLRSGLQHRPRQQRRRRRPWHHLAAADRRRHHHPDHLPNWVIVSCYAAIALGTMFGGWRIVKTMARRSPSSGRRRLRGRDRRRAHLFLARASAFRSRPRTPSPGHRRRRLRAAHSRRAVGRRRQHRGRLDHHHARRGRDRRDRVLAGKSLL